MTLKNGHDLVEVVESQKLGGLVMTDKTAVFAANPGDVSGRSSNSLMDKFQCNEHAIRLNSARYVDRFLIARSKGAASFLDNTMGSVGQDSILEGFGE